MPTTIRTVAYGPKTDQVADLYLPAGASTDVAFPVVCLLHGGFWRMLYGREQFDPVARDLAARGFAVWNIEYRRVGAIGGRWPEPAEDVQSAIDCLATLVEEGISVDLECVLMAGHSAGGQLALWFGSRASGRLHLERAQDLQVENGRPRLRLAAVAGLAPLADLERAFRLRLGDDAVAMMLGGSPETVPELYAEASPRALLPLNVRQVVIHGNQDDVVPVETSRAYVADARAAGDDAELIELPGGSHMDFLDPDSEAHAALCGWLETSSGASQRVGRRRS